ncbi:nuclear transport factor 2 family protein [Embleya sp. NPDC005575]|uniref:nuclear transport factor 2 family protein n=1 Tax=Embleya sp. NPDC005575 TaxID=3156892 RepID=UPI0033B91EF5
MGGTRDEAAALARSGPVGDDVGARVRRFTEWAPVAAVFTDEVRVRDHVVGFVEGRHALSAYIRDGVGRSPFRRYRVRLWIIDSNRVSTVLRAEGPSGGLDVNVVLHYAGGRRWSYVEIVYNPQEIPRPGA